MRTMIKPVTPPEVRVAPPVVGGLEGPGGERASGRESALDLSVAIPSFNEEACITRTIDEVFRTLDGLGLDFEVIVVDDGSTDRTPEFLAEVRSRQPRLRTFRLAPNSGQSAALGVAFKASRGRVVVMMDADGQNDPADIPRLLDGLKGHDACCGFRQVRRDAWARRIAGRLANAVRRGLLHDGIIDTGCSLRAIRADLVRDLPMSFKGMHRFIPALLLMQHARLRQIPVHHRARITGVSKYTNFGRLRESIRDLRAVRWMQVRHRGGAVTEVR